MLHRWRHSPYERRRFTRATPFNYSTDTAHVVKNFGFRISNLLLRSYEGTSTPGRKMNFCVNRLVGNLKVGEGARSQGREGGPCPRCYDESNNPLRPN